MERERLPIIEFESQVIEIKTETPTTKTLVFDILDIDFNFYPEQYVMLRVPYPPTGEIPKRAYSIASPPTQKDKLELTIKRKRLSISFHSPLKRVLISEDKVAGNGSPSLPGQGTVAQNRCSFIHSGWPG
jgi:2-polyprenylphenol hydroxylase and related flavodoxin oxidoreductases